MKGFISYAHKDFRQYEELRTHLKAVERIYGIDFWADTRIKPGNYWNDKISAAIADASVHLLLFTPAFIESDYIFDHELPAIKKQHRERGDLVLPLILKPCVWEPFVAVLQAFPSDRSRRLLPVSKWRPKDDGFHEANRQVADCLKDRLGTGPANPLEWGRA
jgi:hypothetical protein